MNVLVVGGGRIGAALAEELVGQGHEVVVVEKEAAVASVLASRLPSVEVVHGDGDEPVVLESARVSAAHIMAAMAHEDEDNLVACLLAKREYGVARTFARVNTAANEWLFGERFGVDGSEFADAIDVAVLAQRLTAP